MRGLVRLIGGPALSLLARSWRLEYRHRERYERSGGAGEGGPRVYLLWHEVLYPLLWAHRGEGIGIVVSENRDGRYLADYARRLGYRDFGGSTSRGGARAFRAALRHLHAGGILAVTPDGPRGPRRSMKHGALVAAQRAGAMVQVTHAVARPAWRMRSWDRFLVPRPLARVRIGYGVPFAVGEGPEAIPEAMARANRELAALEGELEWPDVARPTA